MSKKKWNATFLSERKKARARKLAVSGSYLTSCLGGFIFSLLFVEFAFLLRGRILVLLIFRDEIVHVGFGFSELHFVHTLTGVPMQESLAPEHSCELLGDSLEKLLDGGRVADESGGHLEAAGRDVTNGGLDVVGDPLNEV